MKQGILTSQRVRILFSDGHSCFRIRRHGERKRKSIRGCIVSSALAVLNLVIVKKGDADIPGLTDETKPRRLGPKRASRIRKLFNLSKDDDVRQYVVRRQINKDGKKPYTKAPKIQRLVTPQRLQHKRQLKAEQRRRWEKSAKEATEYNNLLAKYLKEKRDQKLARKRSASRRESSKEEKVEKKQTTEHPHHEKKQTSEKKHPEQPKAKADDKKPQQPKPKADDKKQQPQKPKADASKKADKSAAAQGAKKHEEKKGDQAKKQSEKKPAPAQPQHPQHPQKPQQHPPPPKKEAGDKKPAPTHEKKQQQPKTAKKQ